MSLFVARIVHAQALAPLVLVLVLGCTRAFSLWIPSLTLLLDCFSTTLIPPPTLIPPANSLAELRLRLGQLVRSCLRSLLALHPPPPVPWPRPTPASASRHQDKAPADVERVVQKPAQNLVAPQEGWFRLRFSRIDRFFLTISMIYFPLVLPLLARIFGFV